MKHLFWIALVLSASPAFAACTTPTGADGSYSFNATDRNLYHCIANSWVLDNGGVDTTKTPYTLNGFPTVGASGGNVVQPCNTAIGQRCGGGFYAGDGNLVVTPGACTASGCPSVVVDGVQVAAYGKGPDTLTKAYKTTDSASTNTSSHRYGYKMTMDNNGTNHPAFNYCDGLNYNGYSDWYLPTRYELDLVRRVMPEVGGTGLFAPFSRSQYYLAAR